MLEIFNYGVCDNRLTRPPPKISNEIFIRPKSVSLTKFLWPSEIKNDVPHQFFVTAGKLT